MNEFEKEMLSMMKEMKADISGIKSEMSEMKAEIADMKSDIEELKEETKITRAAVNYNGEKLEKLIVELKEINVIS